MVRKGLVLLAILLVGIPMAFGEETPVTLEDYPGYEALDLISKEIDPELEAWVLEQAFNRVPGNYELVQQVYGDTSGKYERDLDDGLGARAASVGQRVILDVPYRGQVDGTACQWSNCGPASVAMILEYFGTYQTSASVRSRIGDGSCRYTSINDLYNAAYSFRSDLTYERRSFSSRTAVRSFMETSLRDGKPIIVLIHTGDWPCYSLGSFGHFIVLYGISADGETIYLHDPYNHPNDPNPKGEFYVEDVLDAWWFQITGNDSMAVSAAGYGVPNPTPVPQPWAESGGMVVVEAEDHDYQRVGRCQWWKDYGGSFRPGWQGDGYLRAEPVNGTVRLTNAVELSPRLDYPIAFSSGGTWYVWVRLQQEDSTENTILHGVNGNLGTGVIQNNGANNAWGWTNSLSGGGRATISVPSSGLHTFNLWMNKDGARIDRFVLTTNSGYTPSGSGPPASSRGPAPPTATPTNTATPIPTCGPLLSQGQPVTASSYYQNNPNYAPAKAVDGVIGYDHSRWVTDADTSGLGHWLVVDLGGQYELCQAKIYGDEAYIYDEGTGDKLWNLSGYFVRASNENTGDPRTWAQLARYEEPCGPPYPDYPGEGVNAHNTHALQGNYRFVCLHIDRGDGECGQHARVQEFQVFGNTATGPTPTVPPAPTATATPITPPTATPLPSGCGLVSENRPVTASSYYQNNPNYAPSKAVDGVIGYDHSRWVTDADTTGLGHWLVVDLGAAYDLCEAKVYGDEAYIYDQGSGDKLWNMSGYFVRASNENTGDPRTWTQLARYEEPCGEPYPDYPGEGVDAHNTHPLQGTYRFVCLHIDRGDGECGQHARVQEFQVFGTAATGPTPTVPPAPTATATSPPVQPTNTPSADNTPTPVATNFPGDADGNRFVNGDDFRAVRDAFGSQTCGYGDANGDCFVNGDDFRSVRDNFGNSY